jgi:hypothetical protein
LQSAPSRKACQQASGHAPKSPARYEVETDADIKRVSKMRDTLLSRDLFIGKDIVITAKKSGSQD